ncbi:MAG: transcriptional regulator [Lachnospiraceae bacterium]|nr:transcriptional regulator [Lachnospiraceae bacterium]
MKKNRVTGEKGFNMACILLFGKPEVIQSCVPGYKTDAIYRVKNMDRYDDRLIVENNLIESYDILMQFISKHTDDKFFLVDNVNMSVRSAIAREVVSNLLVHRDFGSAFPAKLIIEKDRIYTENWNRTQRIGRLELEDFTPYPKNPILAKFFVNIGYADGLGSGVRNLYRFTKIYSGGEPDLEEGEVFRLTIPLTASGRVDSAIEAEDSAIETEKVPVTTEKVPVTTEKVPIKSANKKIHKKTEKQYTDIITFMTTVPDCSVIEICDILSVKERRVRKLLKELEELGKIESTTAYRNRRYRLKNES